MYSIKDINSYDELTEEEKKIVSEDTYNKFRVVKPITIEEATKNIKRCTPQQREIAEEVAELKKKLKELDKFIKSPEYCQ